MSLMHSDERPMAAADHAWLRMDTPHNLVVIHLAFVFDGTLTLPRLSDALRTRLLAYPQFTHRIRRGWLGARWRPDAQFSLERHLDERIFPAGATRADLQAWMSAQASQPLPADRPLWKATLAQGIDGGSALVMRVHHSLADGMSLMHVIAGLTEIADDAHAVPPARTAERHELTLQRALRHGVRVLADTLRLIFIPGDRRSSLKGAPQREKSVAWSAPLSLEATRALAHRHGATVNDAMLAVIAEALRRNLFARGCTRIAAPVRTVVPTNMRPLGDERELGNRFGLVGLDLPIHLDDPLQRLLAVRDGMSALKRSFQGQLALTLVRLAGRLPARLQSAVLYLWSRRCTLIVTNVIGPAEPRSLAGVKMDELMLLVPQGMTVGVGISIISYNGALRIGFLVDNALMPGCELAAESVASCFESLQRAASVPAGTSALPALPVDGESFA